MQAIEGNVLKKPFAGVVVYEYELKIGWGKSVALPSQALPAPPPGQMAIRSKEVRKFCFIFIPSAICFLTQFDNLANCMLAEDFTSCTYLIVLYDTVDVKCNKKLVYFICRVPL